MMTPETLEAAKKRWKEEAKAQGICYDCWGYGTIEIDSVESQGVTYNPVAIGKRRCRSCDGTGRWTER